MAAQEVQQGIAKIFAMDGATTVTLTGAATITHHSAGMTQNFDLREEKSQNGEVETLVGSNEHFDVDVEFAPNGATRAAAITSAANMKAAIITKVVLSGFAVAAFNGNWNLIPGSTWRMERDGIVIMGMKLRAYITNRASLTAGLIAG